MLTAQQQRRRSSGFTIVELMITLTVLAILIAAAAPSLQRWVFNARVRSTAEALQNGLRQAQAEAVRRSRQVVFVLTNANPQLNAARNVDGLNWSMQTVPGLTDATGEFVRGGRLASDTAGVVVDATPDGASSICFNSIGALVANAAPGPSGAVCAVSAAVPEMRYDISHPNSDRALRVLVSNGGRVRMCDPARTLAASPDGCPTP